jgi:hypothetical protein
MRCVRDSSAVPQHARPSEDEILARLLIINWALATGRTLRADVPPQLLTEEELITFWADEPTAAGGTSATAAGGTSATAAGGTSATAAGGTSATAAGGTSATRCATPGSAR